MPDWSRPIRSGEPVNSAHPIVSSERANLLSAIARREQGVGPPSPGEKRGAAAGGPAGVAFGVVATASAAAWDDACGMMTPGTLQAWPYATPPAWDPAAAYDAGDVVRLAADAFDADATYSEHDTAEHAGKLYQAPGTVGPDEFDAGDWTLIGDAGDWYCATAETTAGAWDGAEWDATPADAKWVDREGETVTLLHGKQVPPEADTEVAWIGAAVVDVEPPGGGGAAGCPEIEIDRVGGLHFRTVCGENVGTWQSVPAVVCDDGAVNLPVTPPS